MLTNLISRIRVEDLFGLYTYELPPKGELSNAAIFYGDNGVGKSTLLRLVFHLLSPADNRGHRSALYEADFARLIVTLVSGIRLEASFQREPPEKVLNLEIAKGGRRLALWQYRPKARRVEAGSFVASLDSSGRIVLPQSASPKNPGGENVPIGEKAYLSALKEHVPTLFILNADRRLDSDTVADPSDEVELRRVMHYGEPRRINELVGRSREVALSQALSTAGRWISRKAVIGANQGSMNVHSVYEGVLKHLLSPSSKREITVSAEKVAELQRQFANIEMRTEEHARYELATHLSTTDFRKALSRPDKKKNQLAADLLTPYIKSLERRLEEVDPIYQMIDRFVMTLNRFLHDKVITFKLSQGFSIVNRINVHLTPAQLSSGEQQLLLLFCYVLSAREQASVFMIDEPEISLNIKWQRQLIQSLLDITTDASIQFIFASHSMELLAQHRNRVVKLVNAK